MKKLWSTFLVMAFLHPLLAQWDPSSITSDFVKFEKRASFKKNLEDQTITHNFQLPLDTATESQYREACWAIAQFLVKSPLIESGFKKLFLSYSQLGYETKRAMLEAVYATYPALFQTQVSQLITLEQTPKLFAMQALYLLRANASSDSKEKLIKQLVQQFPAYQQNNILSELYKYLLYHNFYKELALPDLNQLFLHQQTHKLVTIYSFQKWNRDYPGLAALQQFDGHFLRDSMGNILLIDQLARAGSNLPYFITNGNTPQGIYSITGTEVSKNLFIGPTPNLQLLMPFEADSAFWHMSYDSSKEALLNYLQLLPKDWANYKPMQESFYAGKAGRSEILAHGTTIDPEYFKGFPFYPISPTLGCLCAKEIWNIFNGQVQESHQLQLANGLMQQKNQKGLLIVVNIDNQDNPVSKKQITALLEHFEKTVLKPSRLF
jgi:hypothetical protein